MIVTTWLAVLVTFVVVFAVFFGGVLGPLPATATAGILYPFILPVVSAGGASTIGSRLEGWWLASAAGTLAVLLLSQKSDGDRIGAAASRLATEIATRVRAASAGESTDPAVMWAAKERMWAAFNRASYRPTGLASADQALASVVQLLDWSAGQAADAFDGHIDMTQADPREREVLAITAGLFDDVAALLSGRPADPAFEKLEEARVAAARRLRDLSAGCEPAERIATAHAVHAQVIAVAARSSAADALIAARRADPAAIAAERRRWSAPPGTADPRSRPSGISIAAGVVIRHASVRSVWFVNSLRAAAAIAAAQAYASLRMAARQLAAFYGRIADEVGHPGLAAPELPAAPPVLDGSAPRLHPHLLWVQENLHDLGRSAHSVSGPALRVAEARRGPWWR